MGKWQSAVAKGTIMVSYRELAEAKELLELPDRASMEEIRSSYKRLLKRWHPDTCTENREGCADMTRRIVAAYRIIAAYCATYEYSFEEDELRRHLSTEEWWMDRFGQDPLWGGGKK